MKLTVKYLDGTEQEVVRTASSLRSFEEKNKISLNAAIDTGRSWWADEIAHHVLVQKHGEERPFDDWLDDVETILMQRPQSDLDALVDRLGWKIVDGELVPTRGAAEEASRADSSTPQSSSVEEPESSTP